MSGIAGFCNLDRQPANAAMLDRMLDAIGFRGPDGVGRWCGGAVALGTQVLHTTPESLHERWPMRGRGGALVLTADARVDNRAELMAALGIGGDDVVTDGELILAAYEQWGVGCVERMVGDFAFALWDADRRELFCARDPIGIKPFYYHHQPGRLFAFASQVKPITDRPDVPRRLNEARVADYLADVIDDPVVTFQEGVLRLPAAHWMVVSEKGVRQQRYWALDPDYELRLGSDAEYAEAFRALFMETMRCRMRCNGRATSTLSGGLDSSTIACCAAALERGTGRRWPIFTALYEATREGDERRYIDAVIGQADLEPHFIHSDRIGTFADYEEMFRYVDEPTDNPFSSIGWELRRVLREYGARAVLDGNGGDITVSYGFDYLAALARAMRWGTLRREAAALAKRFFGNPRAQLRIWGQWVLWPLLPTDVYRLWKRISGRDLRRLSINVPIEPAFARRVGLEQRLGVQYRRYCARRTVRQRHIYGFERPVIPWAMEFADKAAAAFAFEGRYPFFDRRLIEFCVALPREQRVIDGWTRMILRRAMADLLPEVVCWRGGKGNPNPNFALALVGHERATLDEVILGRQPRIAAYVDVTALRQLYRRFLAEHRVRDAYRIWPAVTLELWLRAAGFEPT